MSTETTSTTKPALALTNYEVKDEDLPAFRDMKFENINELELDHPGANDADYRKRRDHIAGLSKNFRETGMITDVEYTAEEQKVWQIVATKLEEIQSKRAIAVLSGSKKKLGITTTEIPQLSEMNKRFKELDRISARAD